MTEYNLSDCLYYLICSTQQKYFRIDGHIYRDLINGLDTNLWEINGSVGILKKTKRYLKEKEEFNENNMESSKEEEPKTPRNDEELDKKYKNKEDKELGAKTKKAIDWALNKPPKLYKKSDCTMKKQRDKAKEEEKKWGNMIIGQKNNTQWTTKLGEDVIMYNLLEINNENPIKPKSKEGFQPDCETDDYIYEVKTWSWWCDGTAHEKVLGTAIKYRNIPELYNKPLRIICIGRQEWEMTYGKTPYFGNNVDCKTKELLELYKSWKIEYIPLSEYIKNNEILKNLYKFNNS
jgi:hypothetical protein